MAARPAPGTMAKNMAAAMEAEVHLARERKKRFMFFSGAEALFARGWRHGAQAVLFGAGAAVLCCLVLAVFLTMFMECLPS